MSPSEPRFEVRVAESAADLRAAQRLRYDVFVTELGGDGPLVDHAQRLERDRFDPYCEHLLLIDTARAAEPDGQGVGVYRVMTEEGAARAGQFYCADEYDLAPLLSSGRKVLELGRSCLHRDYRGGAAIYHLWNGLARVTLERRIEVLFGVASFHGTDVRALAAPLATGVGVIHVPQPRESLARMSARVHALDPFRLAALHDLVALSGALVIGLAALTRHRPPDALWALSRIDETWQAEQWGEDDIAAADAAGKRAAFLHAAQVLERLESA